MFDHHKKKIQFAILLSFVFLFSCSSKNSKNSQQAELYFNAGTQSLMTKDYTNALTSLLKANQLTPENPNILTNLGMAYYFKGDKETAIKTILKAIKLDPENPDAKNNLASIYFNEKNYTQSEKIYKQVLKNLTYDKQARTYYNLGLIELEVKKDFTQAENYFKLSIKEDENYCPAYFQLGVIFYARKQYNSALKNFKEAGSGTCYEAPAPHYHQGLTLVKLKKFDDARMKFDEVETRFKKSSYASKARMRSAELKSNELNVGESSTNISEKSNRTISF